MLATLSKGNAGFVAIFERRFDHPVERVWTVLTENDQLAKWMSHLEIKDMSKGGLIIFNHNNGSGQFEEMKITDYEERSVIEFEWGNDIVRFEVRPTETGSLLILKEIIKELTDHTPKDLAGWHMCLNIFEDVVNGVKNQLPDNNEWEKWYEEYKKVVGQTEI